VSNCGLLFVNLVLNLPMFHRGSGISSPKGQLLHSEILNSLALAGCANLVRFVGRRVLFLKTFLFAKVTA
jgi:hypothetical protein